MRAGGSSIHRNKKQSQKQMHERSNRILRGRHDLRRVRTSVATQKNQQTSTATRETRNQTATKTNTRLSQTATKTNTRLSQLLSMTSPQEAAELDAIDIIADSWDTDFLTDATVTARIARANAHAHVANSSGQAKGRGEGKTSLASLNCHWKMTASIVGSASIQSRVHHRRRTYDTKIQTRSRASYSSTTSKMTTDRQHSWSRKRTPSHSNRTHTVDAEIIALPEHKSIVDDHAHRRRTHVKETHVWNSPWCAMCWQSYLSCQGKERVQRNYRIDVVTGTVKWHTDLQTPSGPRPGACKNFTQRFAARFIWIISCVAYRRKKLSFVLIDTRITGK